MTLHPKAPIDLALAPVAASIDLNLQDLRDKAPNDVSLQLALVLDRPPIPNTMEERAAHVLRAAVRNVEMHGWTCSLSDDRNRIHLDGGSVSIELGLGLNVTRYIEDGGEAH